MLVLVGDVEGRELGLASSDCSTLLLLKSQSRQHYHRIFP